MLPGIPATIDTNAVVDQMVRRASSLGFDRGGGGPESVGFCAHPIQLTGTDEFGRDRVMWTRCNNRRAQVCPSCSDLYARDTWQLVARRNRRRPPRRPRSGGGLARKCSSL